MTALAPAFRSVDPIAGLNLNYRKCCWVQHGTEGRDSLRTWISENCDEFRMLDFGQLDFGQFDFGQLAGIELAEVEIGRNRNWPKSKLIGRSRTDGACSMSSFSFFFFFYFVFLLFYRFYCSYSSSFFFVLFLFSSPET